jgi:hypothetical protein
MAGIYSIAKNSAAVAVTGGGILGELSAVTNRVKVREIGVFMNSTAGGAVTVAVGRPGNTPTTGTAALGNAEDMVDTQAATSSLITAGWGTAPTVPTVIYRQIVLPATVGAGVIWQWAPGDEIVLGTTRNLGLVIWAIAQTIAASQTCSIYARWTE